MYRANLNVEDEKPPSVSAKFSWMKRAYESSEHLISAASNMLSCDATISLLNTWGTSISKNAGKNKNVVDIRGRRTAEIAMSRRPAFLSGPDAVMFTASAVDDPSHRRSGVQTCQVKSGLGEAPFSGSWRGKYYDGFQWQDVDFTLFFQDLIGKQTGSKNNSGFISLDIMGSCAPTCSKISVPAAVVGCYNPNNGRVCWSQPSPSGEAIWEVWAQLYASVSGGEDGLVADRMLASWQDTEGRRGNMELILREGDAFAVGGSFWSTNGLDPFVHEVSPTMTLKGHSTGSGAAAGVTLPPGWSLPPGQFPKPEAVPHPGRGEARLEGPCTDELAQEAVPVSSLDDSAAITAGEGLRLPARLDSALLYDPSNTLV